MTIIRQMLERILVMHILGGVENQLIIFVNIIGMDLGTAYRHFLVSHASQPRWNMPFYYNSNLTINVRQEQEVSQKIG